MQLKTDLSKYKNDWYKTEIGASRIKQMLWYFINATVFASRLFPVSSLKAFLLRLFGAEVGASVVIKPAVNIKYPWKLKIGSHSWVGENVWIDNLAPVSLGNNVCISQGAMLLTGNHNFKKANFDLIVSPIIIEDGAWIGTKAIVCPGVTCKSHCVLAVSSIAVSDLEAYGIYQGNPAVFKKERIIL